MTWPNCSLYRSITLHGRRNVPFFGNLAKNASCVDDKTVVSLHILNNLFFSNLPQIYHYVIRPYHLKKGKNPYWIRTIRTSYQVACTKLVV